ncbi:recombinase family protein, partial [Ralstonia pseudosolanacearum]
QQFNTTTSMGRLMLNVLLSFAQFEREVTGERIRDKIAASKRKGMWMGGVPPLGYDVLHRKLIVNEAEAMVVRRLFAEFPRATSTTLFVQRLRHEGVMTKSWVAQSGNDRAGKLMDKGALYKILNNPVYLGQIRHKGISYAGEHELIVTQEQWDAVQQSLTSKPAGVSRGQIRSERPALLKGLIFTADGRAMTPHSTKGRGGRLYRYYLSTRDAQEGYGASDVRMLPAGEVDEAVVAQLRGILRAPEMVARVWREVAGSNDSRNMTEMQVAVALSRIDIVWENLFPLEQHRIVQLLVERVVVSQQELRVQLHRNGIEHFALDVVRAAGGKSVPAAAGEALA